MVLGTPELVSDLFSDEGYWPKTVLPNPTGPGILATTDGGIVAIASGVVTAWNTTTDARGEVDGVVQGSAVLLAAGSTIRKIEEGTTTSVWFAGDVWAAQVVDLAIAPDSTVWATTNSNQILRLTSAGVIDRIYVGTGTEDDALGWSGGIAFDPADNDTVFASNRDPFASDVGGVWAADRTTETYVIPGDEPWTYWSMDLDRLWSAPVRQVQRNGVAVHGGRIYFTSWDNTAGVYGIWSIPKAGGTPALEFDDPDGGPDMLTVIGDWLYFTDGFNGRVYRAALTAGASWTVGYIGFNA